MVSAKLHIAVLLTVFNRKEITLRCLRDIYAQECIHDYAFDIFVVDGGSTDGTPDAIKKHFPDVHVYVCNGLYWAGGMRMAWNLAMQHAQDYNFFWLLNDDTHIYPYALQEGLDAHQYSIKEFGKGGLYIGSTKSPVGQQNFSYGCRRLVKSGSSKTIKILPNGTYQTGDLANANIMMVSREVYDTQGGFCTYCTHGIADYEYSLRATRNGYPCIACPSYCGECEDDHGNNWKSANVSLIKRINYLYSPKGLAYREYIQYIRTFFPQEVFAAKTKLWMKTIFPVIWDKFKEKDCK